MPLTGCLGLPWYAPPVTTSGGRIFRLHRRFRHGWFALLALASCGCGARSGLLPAERADADASSPQVGDAAGQDAPSTDAVVDAGVDVVADAPDAPAEATDADHTQDAPADAADADDAAEVGPDAAPGCGLEGSWCSALAPCCAGVCAGATCVPSSVAACVPGDPPVILSFSGPGRGIAVDASHMYWSIATGSVMRIPKTGGFPQLVASLDSEQQTLAFDDTNVYAAGSPGVFAINKQTFDVATLWPTASGYPWSVKVDNEYVYFSSYWAGTLSRMPKSGGTPQVLLDGFEQAFHLAVDTTRVYMIVGKGGSIHSVGKDGSDPQVLISGVTAPWDIVVDDTWVYFTQACGFGCSTLSRIPKAGGSAEVLVDWVGSLYGLALHGGTLYFAEADASGLEGAIHRVSADGTGHQLILSGIAPPLRVATDGACVYWYGSDANSPLMRAGAQ